MDNKVYVLHNKDKRKGEFAMTCDELGQSIPGEREPPPTSTNMLSRSARECDNGIRFGKALTIFLAGKNRPPLEHCQGTIASKVFLCTFLEM